VQGYTESSRTVRVEAAAQEAKADGAPAVRADPRIMPVSAPECGGEILVGTPTARREGRRGMQLGLLTASD